MIFHFLVTPQSCGKSPVSRVIGGVNDKPRSWPRQVRLFLENYSFVNIAVSL